MWVHTCEANLPVYKFFCFDGEPKIIQAIQNDKQKNESIDYFDTQWNLLKLRQNYPNSEVPFSKPRQLDKMLDVVRKLASGKQGFIRVDLYSINGEVYFSEYTFFSDCGFAAFEPEEWDKKLGEMISLSEAGGGTLINSGCLSGIFDDDCWLQKMCIKPTQRKNMLTDYKFYCFGGKPEYLYVSTGLENHKTASISFLTLDWEFAPFGRSDYTPFSELPQKPSQFEKMKALASKLAAGHLFLRVDLYQVNDQIYFSEMTFHPCSGMMPFEPKEWDAKLGSLLRIV